MKRLVRKTVKTIFLLLVVWSATDEDKAKVEDQMKRERPSRSDMERDAAYLTTGLITAARALDSAHENGEDCTTHHEALVSLLTSIDNPMIAIRAIQHLVEIVAHKVDDEDVQRMVSSLVAIELNDDDDDEDDILNWYDDNNDN